MLLEDKSKKSWNTSARASDFFYLKGVVHSLLQKLGVTDIEEKEVEGSIFSEGLQFIKNKQVIVEFGLVQKKISKAFDIDKQAYYAEVYWEELFEMVKEKDFVLKPIPRYPMVNRDFALLLDEAVRFTDLQKAAFKVDSNLLQEVNLFDVYTGDNLPAGKKSYALSFTLLDSDKTLTDKQIDVLMGKLQKTFETQFGASLR